jgi:hypothetical protein
LAFYLCLTALIISSRTTPAKRTPIIKMIYDEKLEIISDDELAIDDEKFAGSVIILLIL